MEKGAGKEADPEDYSSRTAVDGSEPEKAQAKPKKKKKGCTCRGFSDAVLSATKMRKLKLEGSPWFRERQIWAAHIKRQRQDLLKVKPAIDDAAPRLSVGGVYDVEILKTTIAGLKSAFETNQNVLRSLHEVNLLRGKTETFDFNYGKPAASNYATRKDRAKNIEKQNEVLLKALRNPASRMPTAKEYAEDWRKNEGVMESSSEFPLWWKAKKVEQGALELAPPLKHFKQHVTEKSAKYPDKRPRVFLEVSIRNVGVVGRMVVMLYADYVPTTVKNFLAFCDPKARLTYKGNLFYLVFENYYCQTGDVVENRGFGGTSIYGPYFGNEDFAIKHGERGILTMHAKIPNRNASQFLITFRKLESLDGQNVAFGKVVKGLHVLDAIEGVGSKKTGRPKVEIYISDCDEI